MRWFRSKVRVGAVCALFALAVQFALSFGHVHFNGFAPSSAFARFIAAVDAEQPAAVPNGQTDPSKQKGDADDFCAIGALIHLAGTLVPSAAPPLPTPAAFSALRLDLGAEHHLAASKPDFFQARAPPIS